MGWLQEDYCAACQGDKEAENRLKKFLVPLEEHTEELKTNDLTDRRRRRQLLEVASLLNEL
jgi:hypothetical protein